MPALKAMAGVRSAFICSYAICLAYVPRVSTVSSWLRPSPLPCVDLAQPIRLPPFLGGSVCFVLPARSKPHTAMKRPYICGLAHKKVSQNRPTNGNTTGKEPGGKRRHFHWSTHKSSCWPLPYRLLPQV